MLTPGFPIWSWTGWLVHVVGAVAGEPLLAAGPPPISLGGGVVKSPSAYSFAASWRIEVLKVLVALCNPSTKCSSAEGGSTRLDLTSDSMAEASLDAQLEALYSRLETQLKGAQYKKALKSIDDSEYHKPQEPPPLPDPACNREPPLFR